MRFPSGEKYAQNGNPEETDASFCFRFPSASQIYKSEPVENTNRLPSGDHAAQPASKSPILLGEPDGSGKFQMGVSDLSVVPTRSCERSALMSIREGFLMAVGTIETSPPFTDICAITEP